MRSSAGFYWSRAFAGLDSADREAVDAICAGADTDFIVTGHTVHAGEIVSYGGRIFDVDVGMTPTYGENPPSTPRLHGRCRRIRRAWRGEGAEISAWSAVHGLASLRVEGGLLGTEDHTQTYGVVLPTLLLGLGVSPELAGPALETTLRLWGQGVSLVGGPPR
jgi:hypothetical protein